MISDLSSPADISLSGLYADNRGTQKDSDVIRTLLDQSDWFCHAVEFDPRSGQALPQSLSSVLARMSGYSPPSAGRPVRDRLWRIVEHSRHSVERLFRGLNEAPRREQALLPVHAVRELDANSFIKLSNRPGRNIREKLAGNPYLQGVRRFQSINLPENRLLKAFVEHLAQLLELRRDILGHEDELLLQILTWLRSGEARDIGRWENLPPNNTLLSHRDYRRVWDAWRLLQSLEDDLSADHSRLPERIRTKRLWNTYAQMWRDGSHRFADMPVFFDYDRFEIRPWFSKVVAQRVPEIINRNVSVQDIRTPVCVDFATLRPRYATGTTVRSLPDAFLWQKWRDANTAVALDLFTSDAIYAHAQATTLSSADLFFSRTDPEQLDPAARAFASRLHSVFRHETLIWLVPDALNDFELDVTRRNVNARFQNAIPLPRSIAAAFLRADYSKVRNDSAIVVIDSVGGKTCVTKLIARFDPELKKVLPETNGFYWERHPPVIISNASPEMHEEKKYEIPTLDDQGQWREAPRATKPAVVDAATLRNDPRIGQFAFAINLTNSPVTGGIRLHSLQQRAGGIALWRDQIPELSIKAVRDGLHRRFHLVSRGTTVKPLRGRSVAVEVGEDFTLPAGRTFYQFPLFLGDSTEDLGYSARLESPAFPLEKDVVCKLHLTFEYGADDPYKLIFKPRNGSFQQVNATWCRTADVIITDAPAPQYPAPMTWADLHHVPKDGGDETSDLLDWITDAIVLLDQDIDIRPRDRTTGVISTRWRQDKHEGYFTFANTDLSAKKVFIHQKSFIDGISHADFVEGSRISFEVVENAGKCSGRNIAGEHHQKIERLKVFDDGSINAQVIKMRQALYYPVIQTWRDGRSIDDAECPQAFADATRTNIHYLASLLHESQLPKQIKDEIRFLMCCMHSDAPDECVQWITEQVSKDRIDNPRAIGFALGRVVEPWQQSILSGFMERPTESALRVFAYAIWRDRHFVERFDVEQMTAILDSLNTVLGQIKPCPPRKKINDKRTTLNWLQSTTEPLELLLGLLRARNSPHAQIRMLLQPHQKITKELANQVERVTEFVAQSNGYLYSRVQINIEKPQGDQTPELLFALRLYLTGDDGANAIHITSVSDKNDE